MCHQVPLYDEIELHSRRGDHQGFLTLHIVLLHNLFKTGTPIFFSFLTETFSFLLRSFGELMDDNQNLSGVPESEGETKEVTEAVPRICDNDAVDKLLERQGVAVSSTSG